MKKLIILVGATLIGLQGCVVQPTAESMKVRVIQNTDDCEYLGTVTGSGSMGWTTAHDAEGAINEVRNDAAALGANAISIANVDSSIMTSTSVANAYYCENI